MNRFALVSAKTPSEAASAASALTADLMALPSSAASESSILMAGGIDVLDLMKERLLAPGRLVSLSRVPGLDSVATSDDGSLRIGAMVTLARLANDPFVTARYPALAAAAGVSASPQIRNVATFGGNLLQRPRCWYFRSAEFRCLRKGGGHCFAIGGENQYHAIFGNALCAIVHPSTAATVLVALGAEVELADAQAGTRRVLLEDFLVDPGRDMHRENDLKQQELMTAIVLPPQPAGARMAHLKQGEKDSFDWPIADAAVVLDCAPGGICKSASVILGAAAPVPHRAKASEAALAGKPVGEAVAREAGRAALEGATPLSKNTYKLPLFETLVRRAILTAFDGGTGARGL